ncbi:MAG: carbon starvation protein A [Candidatus Omnitrophota bacterium]
MNSAVILLITLILFIFAYKFFGKKLKVLFGVDPNRRTPAYSSFDGIDYVPARHWTMLFGHHFASIAGAGPIIGPVIACAFWGWGPCVIWIIVGSIFFGAVHDFGALMISIRHNGSTIGQICEQVVSKPVRIIMGIFLWMTLILVIGVFVFFSANSFIAEPKIILPSIGMIPVAVLIGFLLYRRKLNQLGVTVFGLILLVGLIFLGAIIPIELTQNAFLIWCISLLVYAFFASIVPVQVLLQPRDYLTSFLLYFGIGCAILSIFISHPVTATKPFVSFSPPEGNLFPMLFVTVACGAVSGFHALVASGTTSKQIPTEKFAFRISYGGMLLEGVLAIIAVIAVSAGFSNHSELLAMMKDPSGGPVIVFGKGFDAVTKVVFCGYGGLLAMTLLNAFILTTLDTATRIARYLTEELFYIKNRYVSTLIVVFLGGILAVTGVWKHIWPVFGAANQLIAALALMVLTLWLVKSGKSARFTFFPGVIMFILAIIALMNQFRDNLVQKNWMLLLICGFLAVLGVFIFIKCGIIFSSIRNSLKTKRLEL